MRKIDLIERLQRHVEYSLKRDTYARRAIDLLAKGNDAKGMAAAAKAEEWDLKAKSLES